MRAHRSLEVAPDETEARDPGSRHRSLGLAFASPNLKFNKLWKDFWRV
jgi:hypothetical protein